VCESGVLVIPDAHSPHSGLAVYETHDAKHMVAICPTCHDAVHNGPLIIDDQKVYGWKHIKRSKTQRDHVYVEPGDSPKLLLGTIAVTG
jgi:hypothetical protein